MAVVAFGGSVGVAIVDGSLRTLAVADGNVDSLRGARGNVVVDIGVVAGVGDEVEVDEAAAAAAVVVLVGVVVVVMVEDVGVVAVVVVVTRMSVLLLRRLRLVSMSGVLSWLPKARGSHAPCSFLGFQ